MSKEYSLCDLHNVIRKSQVPVSDRIGRWASEHRKGCEECNSSDRNAITGVDMSLGVAFARLVKSLKEEDQAK